MAGDVLCEPSGREASTCLGLDDPFEGFLKSSISLGSSSGSVRFVSSKSVTSTIGLESLFDLEAFYPDATMAVAIVKGAAASFAETRRRKAFDTHVDLGYLFRADGALSASDCHAFERKLSENIASFVNAATKYSGTPSIPTGTPRSAPSTAQTRILSPNSESCVSSPFDIVKPSGAAGDMTLSKVNSIISSPGSPYGMKRKADGMLSVAQKRMLSGFV